MTLVGRYDNGFLRMLGGIILVLGLLLFVPAVAALYYGEDTLVFLLPVPLYVAIGGTLLLLFRGTPDLTPAKGILLITLAWMIGFITSAIPFTLNGSSIFDALFEGVSGLTTTGSTIFNDVEVLSHSILIWRSFLQWVGGIAVVLIFIFLLPMMGIGGKAFTNNEFTDSSSGNFTLRVNSAAKSFLMIYVLLTVAEFILLMIFSVNSFEGVCMTFSNISTGGLMVKNDSIAGYDNIVQAVVLFFMFMGGTNFYLHYRLIYKRDLKGYFKNQEFVWTLIWFIVLAGAITLILARAATDYTVCGTISDGWNALFTVVSIGTSTGYTISDHSNWPLAACALLWMAGMFGAMSGSTAGGIKMYRLLIVKSSISAGIDRMLHPNLIKATKLDGHHVDDNSVSSAIAVTMLFLITAILTVIFLLIAEPDITLEDAFGASFATVGNVGIGLGDFASGCFTDCQDYTKLFLAFMMWVGRMEVLMAIVVFTRSFWREAIRSFGGRTVKVERTYGGLQRTIRDRKWRKS